MREEAVCSRIDISLTSLPPSLLPSASPQMDNKGWNGQKAPFTEATSNSEYRHVSLCLLPFPTPPSLSFPKPPPILQVVLATEMARRLIFVTGQWASDCQLNWPCVLVGSLRIQAHSHGLTGPTPRGPPGSPSTTFLSKKCSLSLRINTQAHRGAHTRIYSSSHQPKTKWYGDTK